MQLLTHRGLEPLNSTFNFLESTKEAFLDQLRRGYGIEFDINFSSDGVCFIFHDTTAKRITDGIDGRSIIDLSWQEIKSSSFARKGTLMTFEALLEMIFKEQSKGIYSALHLKGKFQKPEYLIFIINILKAFPGIECKILIFDVKIETARFIREHLPKIKLFPSVAHLYDIERYNEVTEGTLLSIDEVLENVSLFDGVWLDEWDTNDKKGGKKIFYSEEVFHTFRNAHLQIALVTPELHGTSPGLLGGELHSDSVSLDAWKLRMKNIANLDPDYICSDYIELLK